MRMNASRWALRLIVLPLVFGAAACPAGEAVKTAGMKAEVRIDADYPVFDVPHMDNIIKGWLTAHASMIMDNAGNMPDADLPEMILHVKIDYKATDGPAGIVNVVFTTRHFPNLAPHPSCSRNTFVFSPEGEPLSLESLFADPEQALRIFSEQSPKLLAAFYENEDLGSLDDWMSGKD